MELPLSARSNPRGRLVWGWRDEDRIESAPFFLFSGTYITSSSIHAIPGLLSLELSHSSPGRLSYSVLHHGMLSIC